MIEIVNLFASNRRFLAMRTSNRISGGSLIVLGFEAAANDTSDELILQEKERG